MIVERLRIELGDLLDGGKHEATTMHDLETAIAKAARNVQARLFETSELLAANRGSTLFLQRLYQTHGDVSSDVRERTEQLLEKAASAGVAPFEPLMQRDPNSYALRYRGRAHHLRLPDRQCRGDQFGRLGRGDRGRDRAADRRRQSRRMFEMGRQAARRRRRRAQDPGADAAPRHLVGGGTENRSVDVQSRAGRTLGLGRPPSGATSDVVADRRGFARSALYD